MAKPGDNSQDQDPSEGDKKEKPDGPDGDQQNASESAEAAVAITKKSPVSTSTSIIIQSIVSEWSQLQTRNANEAEKLYNLVMESMESIKFIDGSYKLKEFDGLRNQAQSTLHNLMSILTPNQGNDGSVALRRGLTSKIVQSRYESEFEELEFIDSGGFGRVYKVRNKIDNTEYAMKKIPISPNKLKSIDKFLEEVRTMAKLNNPNVVQYKGAWMELGVFKDDNIDKDLWDTEEMFSGEYSDDGDDDDDDDDFTDAQGKIMDMICKEDVKLHSLDSDSTFEVGFATAVHQSLNSSRVVRSQRVKRSSTSEGGAAVCKLEEIRRLRVRRPHEWTTLYIQMALCHSTLKQWLLNRNEAENKSRLEATLIPVNNIQRNHTVALILKQVLSGLEYIHSRNIVHHDIKPSNIFLQLDNGALLVQLGDFGLACPLQQKNHSLPFGTKLYAAPEQLEGHCDPKSDMYSLGIVIFELVESFNTEMERNEQIELLKTSGVNDFVKTQHPRFATIITTLLSRNPAERFSAPQLLDYFSRPRKSESSQILELERKLAQKEEEVVKLKGLLRKYSTES